MLFDPAAVRLDDLKYENLGKLGDEKCGHCQALRYRDEAVPSDCMIVAARFRAGGSWPDGRGGVR